MNTGILKIKKATRQDSLYSQDEKIYYFTSS